MAAFPVHITPVTYDSYPETGAADGAKSGIGALLIIPVSHLVAK